MDDKWRWVCLYLRNSEQPWRRYMYVLASVGISIEWITRKSFTKHWIMNVLYNKSRDVVNFGDIMRNTLKLRETMEKFTQPYNLKWHLECSLLRHLTWPIQDVKRYPITSLCSNSVKLAGSKQTSIKNLVHWLTGSNITYVPREANGTQESFTMYMFLVDKTLPP